MSDAITFAQLLSYDLPLIHQAIKNCGKDCKDVSYHDRVFENKTASNECVTICVYANAFETFGNKFMSDCKKMGIKTNPRFNYRFV